MTSRLPAIKAQAGISDSEIGLALLTLGIASVTMLVSCGKLIRRFSSRRLLQTGALGMCLALPLAGLVPNALSLYAVFAVLGLSIATVDVCMNTQALLLEIETRGRYMGRMQAGYSVGCISGALLGGLFAAAGCSAFMNFLCFSAVSLACWLFASHHLKNDLERKTGEGHKSRLPLFIYFCGLLEICAFAGEGTVGDWGSIFLHSEKGASESLAALSFGLCAVAMASVRMVTDSLREKIGDVKLLFTGAMTAAAGFALSILASSPVIALAGFVLVGAGIAPAIPVIMSRAGTYPGVDPGEACSAVSTIGYGTLLFLPPLLGLIADRTGFSAAFSVTLAFCLLLAAGSLRFRH